MNTDNFIGRGKREAQNMADRANLIFRLVSADGEVVLGMPTDIREDRLCVEVVADRVVKAWVS